MTVGLPLVSDIAETPRVTIVDSKYTADGKVEPQQRMSPKGEAFRHAYYIVLGFSGRLRYELLYKHIYIEAQRWRDFE